MATAKNTIKNWFKTGLKPTQEQFWAWIDSYWHKDEKIPITAIEDIDNILDEKADAEALTNHLNDLHAHADLLTVSKIYQLGELQVFKVRNPEDVEYTEQQQAGDYCIGFVQGQFINANFLGGDKSLLSSYNI